MESPQAKHFKPVFSWAAALLSVRALPCPSAGCGCRIPCLSPAEVRVLPWLAGHSLSPDRAPQPSPHSAGLGPYSCPDCFSAAAGRRPWLFAPARARPFGYSTHFPAASMATPWLCSCFPAGMLSPQTGSRLPPVPSPMTITLAGSAGPGCALTAHHPLLFPLDNQFQGCWLQAVVAFLQHPAPQGLATWA